MKWENEAEIALKATSLAGGLLIDAVIQGAKEKSGHKDIVTEYDVTTGQLINSIIKERSSYHILNEETYTEGDLIPFSDSPYWVVDPIDGTTNFSTGMALFACSVGLIYQNDFVLGSIYAPRTKELYFTYGDQGSYLNGKMIRGQRNVSLSEASVAASFSNSKSFENQRRKQYEVFGEINEKARALLRLGSAALNIAYVCDGRLHGAYGLSAKIWDIGAGLALAKQAGCAVFAESTDKINYNYIVGTESVVSEIKEILISKELIHAK